MAKAKQLVTLVKRVEKAPWVTAIFCIVMAFLWVAVGHRGPLSYGDTGDYITGSPIRPPLYTAFIHAHLSQWPVSWPTTSYAWPAIMRDQLILIFLSTLALFAVAAKIRWWAPYLIVGLYWTLRIWKAHWGPILNDEVFYAILSEGIKLPWFISLNALVLWTIFRPSRWIFPVLGAWAYVGIEINPNCVTLGALCFVPLILLKDAAFRKKFGWVALLAPLVFCGSYFVRCSLEQAKGGTFSVVPFDGFTSITVALQFAEPDQIELFKDLPNHRRFFELMLEEPCRTKRRTPECPEVTAFWFEIVAYKNVFAGREEMMGHFNVNRFFKEVSGPLLTSRFSVIMNWQFWVLKNILRGLRTSPIFRLIWMALAFFAIRLSVRNYRQSKSALALIPLGYFLVYGATIFLATALVVYDNRYMAYGEMLVIPAVLVAVLMRARKNESPTNKST